MSLCRRQGFIEAPVEVVWDLISDIERHPEWWPRVIEVQCDGLEEGCTYRQLTQTPLGKDEMNLLIEQPRGAARPSHPLPQHRHLRPLRAHRRRGGTFVDSEMGMEPQGLKARIIDADRGPPLLHRLDREDAGGARSRRPADSVAG